MERRVIARSSRRVFCLPSKSDQQCRWTNKDDLKPQARFHKVDFSATSHCTQLHKLVQTRSNIEPSSISVQVLGDTSSSPFVHLCKDLDSLQEASEPQHHPFGDRSLQTVDALAVLERYFSSMQSRNSKPETLLCQHAQITVSVNFESQHCCV